MSEVAKEKKPLYHGQHLFWGVVALWCYCFGVFKGFFPTSLTTAAVRGSTPGGEKLFANTVRQMMFVHISLGFTAQKIVGVFNFLLMSCQCHRITLDIIYDVRKLLTFENGRGEDFPRRQTSTFLDYIFS